MSDCRNEFPGSPGQSSTNQVPAGRAAGTNVAAKADDQALKRVLPEVKLVEMEYRRRDLQEKAALRESFQMGERQAFLAHLAQQRGDEMRAQGFTERNFESLRRGKVPHGYNVHHIKPLDDGGDNRFENLVLMRAHPDHEAIHRYLDPQLKGLEVGQTRKVTLPEMAPGAYRGRISEFEAANQASRGEAANQASRGEAALQPRSPVLQAQRRAGRER